GGAEKGSAQEAQGSKLPEIPPTSRRDTTRQVHFSSDKEHDRLRKECWSLRGTAFQFGASPRNRRTSIHKMDPVDSTKRLEVEVKRLGSPRVQGEHEGASAAGPHNLASPEVSYVGSKVDHEGAFPTGLRHRVLEAPLGSKLGYHELDDEKEEGDQEWMLGEASSLSGAGSRGSKNWVLKIMVPILLIVGIICMHQWWTDIKEGASAAVDAVGDAFDRRLEQEAE
ncbi:unnamed protein product, partial [Laminaria digitata]